MQQEEPMRLSGVSAPIIMIIFEKSPAKAID